MVGGTPIPNRNTGQPASGGPQAVSGSPAPVQGVADISVVGSFATPSGMWDVLYDAPNEFIGLRQGDNVLHIFNVEETTRLIQLLQEAQSLTQPR